MKQFIALVGADIVTPFRIIKKSAIVIEDNLIYEMGKMSDVRIPDNTDIIDVSGHTITPGFVDLLVHGGAGGRGFSDENEESIRLISEYFIQYGTTSMLASLHAKPHDRLIADIKLLAEYIEKNPDTNIRGIHLEGPYLNPILKGAMNESYLWKPTVESWYDMWNASKGHIKLMTIAPELPGAIDVIREATRCGVVISIGHSMATYEDCEHAIDNGAAHVTHMFNAMRPFEHRKPGIILAALLRDELKIELIADTYHVHPATMEMLYRFKKANGIILITDSIRAGGMHEGETEFSDQKVIVKNEMALLEDGTLAGSTLTLNKAIRNMVEEVGAKLTDAVRMASLNGAKVIGIKRGILQAGKVADLVVMDKQYNVLMTIINGKIRYKKIAN
ncbi:MAG TPA: N-acetylglucosamine-6-phosphate deacetylase [Ignavibacteriales bacterium]|mgnify:CR=1 FL=1|nr:N-acetylglucosamine-6-phosphate deacetylase [Ignavibacteriales bacterium]HOL81186.1 N-acetylglucosamine-6-phosphate deacetylase [Ignavibacteriales bacterium]HOM65289.1 N-acetylglucosamine-6-phosphate deacetylase [Ignavibacteriales bacterium]HPD68123.1 N-acetylglucosamine-6-phosphate deacetylase [Ignavibacteriales bacterium]HPP33458.1 N-acetylglucosamine-6-phosphate deacetylase [Ignavibacteriales bacterium]